MKTLEQIVKQLAALPDPETTPDRLPRIRARGARTRVRQRGALVEPGLVDRSVCQQRRRTLPHGGGQP